MGKASESTKQDIAGCFMGLVAASPNPRRRIDVTALVRELGVDRKTFYNHFDNTADLAIWIFRTHIARMLLGPEFYHAELDYPDPALHDKYADMPCYARFRKPGGSTLDQGIFFQAQCKVLNEHDEYYRRIFSYPCYMDFHRYVELLTIPLIRTDIQVMLGPQRTMPDEALDFLSEYHAAGIWGRVRLYYTYKNQPIPTRGLDLFWNYAHESIRATLDALIASGRGVSGPQLSSRAERRPFPADANPW